MPHNDLRIIYIGQRKLITARRNVPWKTQGIAGPSQVPDNLRERLPSSAKWRRSPPVQRRFDFSDASAAVVTTLQIGGGLCILKELYGPELVCISSNWMVRILQPVQLISLGLVEVAPMMYEIRQISASDWPCSPPVRFKNTLQCSSSRQNRTNASMYTPSQATSTKNC